MTMQNLIGRSALGRVSGHLTNAQKADLKNLINMAKFYNYTMEEFIETQFDAEKIAFIKNNWG